MTETRIRWEAMTGGSLCGFPGRVSLFEIRPMRGGGWRLTSALPAVEDDRGYADSPGALKPVAERWLEEFTSSLGAVFPPETAKARKSRAWYADWAVVDRDQDGNAILKHKPSGGLYRVLPIEET